jgi:hypothetical protein
MAEQLHPPAYRHGPRWSYRHTPPPTKRNGFATAALVLGIAATVPALMPITSFFAIMLGSVALLFALLSLPQASKGLSIPALVLSVLVAMLGYFGASRFFDMIDDSATESPALVAKPGQFGDGTFLLGKDIPAGVYRSAGAAPSLIAHCHWERLSDLEGGRPSITKEGYAAKNEPVVIQAQSGDKALRFNGCMPFERVR